MLHVVRLVLHGVLHHGLDPVLKLLRHLFELLVVGDGVVVVSTVGTVALVAIGRLLAAAVGIVCQRDPST